MLLPILSVSRVGKTRLDRLEAASARVILVFLRVICKLWSPREHLSTKVMCICRRGVGHAQVLALRARRFGLYGVAMHELLRKPASFRITLSGMSA